MNWQVRYALKNFSPPDRSSAEHVHGDLIRITTPGQPDVLAAISGSEIISEQESADYKAQFSDIEFLCGYRSTCVWTGAAIAYLELRNIGWGNFGTLCSAALDGNAPTASHKVYKFSDRLLHQYRLISHIDREFDRVYHITLRGGKSFRLGMMAEYEPTADAIRSLIEQFGPLDIAWNINPNGSPSAKAIEAGHELGCSILKWDDLKEFMRTG